MPAHFRVHHIGYDSKNQHITPYFFELLTETGTEVQEDYLESFCLETDSDRRGILFFQLDNQAQLPHLTGKNKADLVYPIYHVEICYHYFFQGIPEILSF